MSTTANEIYPYKVGGSLDVNHPTYVVRQADKDFYDRLKRGEFCYVLNSRQTGKSSLRVQTMHKLQAEGISCADIDLTGIVSKQSTEEQWYRDIIKELVSCFHLKVNRRTWWREHDDLSCVHRFSVFVEEVLLAEVTQNIVIFVDEIDSVLSLDFPSDDFFAQIRYFYNKRANKPEYNRLTFALLGVATPSDLIADKNRTPFNIGRAVELYGFQLHEATPLAQGLVGKVSNPQAVLKEVLQWTGGQPFLTQKLCQLVLTAELPIPEDREAQWVEHLVRSQMIENWESQDEQAHFKTIRDRILRNEQRTSRLLGLYQQILIPPQPLLIKGRQPSFSEEGISADDSSEQMELRLSGLVVKQHGKLRVYNGIYEAVFNQTWVNRQLAKLRPYSEAITAWIDSNRQDESRLLRGQALQDALAWAKDKSLSANDYAFLTASQQKELQAERQERQILDEAKRKAEQLITEAKEGTRLEREGVIALRRFEAGEEIEALLTAMQAGQALQAIVKDERPLHEYPSTSPLLALQVILDNIREQNQIQAHQDEVYSVSFSPNGHYIATASGDETARLWDLSGNLLMEFKGHQGAVFSVSVSPDEQYIATASDDGTARRWDLQGNVLGELKGHQGAVNSISLSPNGHYIATASDDQTVFIWSLQGNLLRGFQGHQDRVTSVSFSLDGHYLASASCEGNVCLWDLQGNLLRKFQGHQSQVWSVSFSPDGQKIATASEDCTACLWDLQGNLLKQLNWHQQWVWSVCFSPDGRHLLTGSQDGTATLWESSGINFWRELTNFKGHQSRVNSVSFSPSGQHLATASGDGTIHIWNLDRIDLAEVKEYPGKLLSISYSFEQLLLVTTSNDSTVCIWTFNGDLFVELKGHQNQVRSVSFSPDGQRIATTSEDCTTRIWDLNGNLSVELKEQDKVWSVSFSPDGQHIATGSNDSVARLWDLQGNLLSELQEHQAWVDEVSFSPDGQHLATASGDATARLWDMQGKLLKEFKGHQSSVWKVTFSPDGQYLATASSDGTARLWDIEGHLLVVFQGSQSGVIQSRYFDDFKSSSSISDISFSPDGQYIATAFNDNCTTRLWNLQGDLVAEFHEWREHPVVSISFSPDGRHLAAAIDTRNEKTLVRLWRVEGLDELLARGCDWLKYYLASHPEAREKLKVCQN
jgi:WD40 repeat protein